MNAFYKRFVTLAACASTLVLAACGGGGNTSSPGTTDPDPLARYQVSGAVTGLATGTQVTLLNNGADATVVPAANGNFQFATGLATGAAYAVTVGTAPAGTTCVVTNGSGTIGSANVTTVQVACTSAPQSTYTIGGSVSGLAPGLTVTLANGADALPVTASGAFTFPTAVFGQAAYAVSVRTQPAGQTCAVGSGTGTVAAANVTSVFVNCQTNPTHQVGVRVTGLAAGGSFEARLNGEAITASSNAVVYNFATQIPEEGTYAVTIATQPAFQTCTATAPSGTMGGADVAVAVSCVNNKQFALATNWSNSAGGNSISVYEVNETTGAMTAVGSPVPTGGLVPTSVTVNEAGTLAFVTNSDDDKISVFSINGTTGALTAVPGSPFAAGGQYPASIVVNKASTAAYVVYEGAAQVSAFTVNPTTGALTPNGSAPLTVPVPAATGRRTMAIHPAGTFVFVADSVIGNAASFAVNASTGALTAVGAYSTSASPTSIAVNAAGTQLLVTTVANTVARLSIDASGALALQNTTASGGGGSIAVAFDGASSKALVAHTDGVIAPFLVTAGTGELTAVPGGNGLSSGTPLAVAVNTAGTLAFVANSSSNQVASFLISATGALTNGAGSPFAAGTSPRGLALARKK